MANNEGIRKTFYIPKEDLYILDKLQEEAKRKDRSENYIVNQALKQYLLN